MALPKDLVAASATPIVLSILSHGDNYGYAIIEEVRRISGGKMEWADGMLYPILHRLEKKKCVTSYHEVAENGRKRKYYRVTRDGLAELDKQRKNWNSLHEILSELGGAQPCFN